LNEGPSTPPTARQTELLALADKLRPELHRYCARLMGSVIEAEDVVQDTFARAFVALDELEEAPPLRAWLFRIAHNRALDLLRSRAIRAAEPIEAAHEVADPESPDPVEVLMRREAVETAVSRFVELPTVQRSVVILKDVLDQSLEAIFAAVHESVPGPTGPNRRNATSFLLIGEQLSSEVCRQQPMPATLCRRPVIRSVDVRLLGRLRPDTLTLTISGYDRGCVKSRTGQ